MVHALSRIHGFLREGGVLVDLHPKAQNSTIEIWQEQGIHGLGEIDQQQDIEDIEYAESCLQVVEERGLYERDGQRSFEMLEHHPSVESWLERWAAEGWTFDVSDEVLDTARNLLTRGGGELVIREPIRAARLNRRP